MGDCVFNWIGTIAGWVLGIITTNYYNIYKKFEGECQIKGELEDIAHDLDVAGRPNEKITIIYGASYIRHHTQKLFGEHNAEALGYYTDIFEPYNRKMEDTTISYDEHHILQHGLKNRMNGILVMNPWLKTIPSEPSIIGFIKYLLKREAESTYIPIREH